MFDYIVDAMADYTVVLEPDEDSPEWWAGAPSVMRDDDGTFYMATRMREGDSPRGKRGYENRILRSDDGKTFEPIAHIRRDDVGIPGFERPSLVKDPVSGKFRLYTCSGLEQGWSIMKFEDADSPDAFDPKAWKVVLEPKKTDNSEFASLVGFKDPSIFWLDGLWHMVLIGFDFVERAFHLVSEDGEDWRFVPERPVMDTGGWHTFYTRPACVLPLEVGFLLVYEGSNSGWVDPVYNIATGLAYTPDLKTYVDLTPDEPILKSTTPGLYHTWRYSHWMRVEDQIYVYFEAARPNKTNEIRLGIFDIGKGLSF